MKKTVLIFIIFIFLFGTAVGQESDAKRNEKKETTVNFRTSRLIYGRTTQPSNSGTLDFRIASRFGRLNSGFEEYFGLDQSFLRIGVDYGITENITVGFGRTKMNKEFDLTATYRILNESSTKIKLPLSLTAFGGVMLSAADFKNSEINFEDRLSTVFQILVSKEFFETFAVQVAPIWVYNVDSPDNESSKHILSVGLGGRLKIAKKICLNIEYYPIFSKFKFEGTVSPLAISIDIDTRGHTFQFFVGNSMATNEHLTLINTTDKWSKGQLHFGFNLVRMFKIN
ncbi:DUF5777 family beta-barrel protein [Bacteroidales bacterium OttesenSCG-928-I21]|nr:DUF5777 family beta-barrel protein [Bacteroidales bacterium OttesenSCG-928-I21]